MPDAIPTATPDALIIRRVVLASCAGAVFEWYDFFIFGVLAAIIAERFFAAAGDSLALVFALGTFAVGFVARPFGALVFGRMGDALGRKRAFMMTLLLMGGATVLIGLTPDYQKAGVAGPVILILLRLIQGFAIGGEYGGAVVYVAEHAPARHRGLLTSLIQTSAVIGLILALAVILTVRGMIGEAAFRDWGWRLPFLLSAGLLIVAIYVRGRLEESPTFEAMRREGRIARAPLQETFLRWPNLKLVLIALFGVMAANGVIWYTAYFYVQFFLERVLRVDPVTVNLLLIAVAVAVAPAYPFFGWLSDRIGRKPVMLAGVLGSLLVMQPVFHRLAEAANPAWHAAQSVSVTIEGPEGDCISRIDLLGNAAPRTACEAAKRVVSRLGLRFVERASAAGSTRIIVDGAAFAVAMEDSAPKGELESALTARLADLGFDMDSVPQPDPLSVFALMALLALLAAAIYGPLAATLAELFPAPIRYTGLSLPYHIGSGWLGGFQPAISFAIVMSVGNPFAGLWYPLAVATIGFIIALMAVPETRGRTL